MTRVGVIASAAVLVWAAAGCGDIENAYDKYCNRFGCDGGGSDAGISDGGASDAGGDGGVDAGSDAGSDAGFDAGSDSGCVGALSHFQSAYPGGTLLSPSVAIGSDVAMIAYTEYYALDGGAQQVIHPLWLDSLQPLPAPGSVTATGMNGVVAATASGFALAFMWTQAQAVQLYFFDDGGTQLGGQFLYPGPVDYPLSLGVEGDNVAMTWDTQDGGPSVPLFVYQAPPDAGAFTPVQPTYTTNGDWFVHPTLANAYPDGGFPLVFGEAFSAGGQLSATYSLRTIASDGSTTDAGIDSLSGGQIVWPAVATAGDGAAIAWTESSGSVYVKFPGDLSANRGIQVADAGSDGGFGRPSVTAFRDGNGGSTVAVAYADGALPRVYLWVEHDGGAPALIPTSGAAPGTRTSLAYDSARGRYDLAFEDIDGGITLTGLCAP